ncbi:MAG: NADH-quinone oxidoreductase subunit I [Desulfotalea sp.]
MSSLIKETITGFISLLVGMRITAREFITPKVTVHYPHETEVMPARFRGHIELIADENGKPLCVSCGLCQKACPSQCISISSVKKEGEKKKTLIAYDLDFTKCSLCGSCVESCAFGAIRFSRVYNHVSRNKEDFYYDLLKDLEEDN